MYSGFFDFNFCVTVDTMISNVEEILNYYDNIVFFHFVPFSLKLETLPKFAQIMAKIILFSGLFIRFSFRTRT